MFRNYCDSNVLVIASEGSNASDEQILPKAKFSDLTGESGRIISLSSSITLLIGATLKITGTDLGGMTVREMMAPQTTVEAVHPLHRCPKTAG
jgi:hypothetical protein